MAALKMFSYNVRYITQKETVANMVDQLLHSDVHIVCFQECDMKNRTFLEGTLKDVFPYCVDKSTARGFKVELCCSGLFIASRFPIEDVKFGGFLEDFVTKGVLGVLIAINEHTKVWVFNTHLQCNFAEYSSDLRTKQIFGIKTFLQQCIASAKGAALLCGDLCMEGEANRKREEYANFISILGGKNLGYGGYSFEEKKNSETMFVNDTPNDVSFLCPEIQLEGLNFAMAFDFGEPFQNVSTLL